MHRKKSIYNWLGAVACAAMAMSEPLAFAAAPDSPQSPSPAAAKGAVKGAALPMPVVRDVALDATGGVSGTVMNASGKPIAGAAVTASRGANLTMQTTTDQQGRFRFDSLDRGVYAITSGSGGDVYRVWNAQAAPPAAVDAILLIDAGDTIRGQMTMSEFLSSEVVVIGAVTIAAVAIPVAIHNSKDDPTPPAS